MNKLFCLIILIFTCRFCEAQNLVPNPGFEQYSTCPNGWGQIYQADDWNIPLFSTTPDYFNACANGIVDVPQSFCGYENAHSGDGFAGILTFHIQQQTTQQKNYREYIQCQLTDSLIAGVDYCISWYVSACDLCNYVCSNMGMYLSNVQINDTCAPNPCNLNYFAQIENPSTNNLNNRNGWTQISGSYIATGGEKFIVIGNFNDTAGTTGSYTGWGVQNGSDLNYIAFYFIDDISVMPCDSVTGITEADSPIQINLFPNPFSNELNITSGINESTEVNIYDITSRKLLRHDFISMCTLTPTALAKGFYFYEVRSSKGVIKKGIVLKQ